MKSLVAFCAVLAWPASAFPQTAQVEADHVYVFASFGADAEADTLRKLGFVVDTRVTTHTGQGTASRSVLFENAYFELIWIDSTSGISEQNRESFAEMQRSAAWRSTGVSPFGLGLRRLAGPEEYGVPAIRHTAEWMEPGTSIALLKQPDEPRSIDVFVLPAYMAVPAWIARVQERAPALLQHANGTRRLTAIEIHGPAAHHAMAARVLSIPALRLVEAAEPMLVLELDGGAAGVSHDLRPGLPVLIRR